MNVQPPRHVEIAHLPLQHQSGDGGWTARRTRSGGLLDFAQARPPVVRGDGGYWTRIPCTPLTPTELGCSSTISSNEQPPCILEADVKLHFLTSAPQRSSAFLGVGTFVIAITPYSAPSTDRYMQRMKSTAKACVILYWESSRARVWYPDSKQRQIDIPATYQHD